MTWRNAWAASALVAFVLASMSAAGAAPSHEKDAPLPVETIGKDDLQKLPGGGPDLGSLPSIPGPPLKLPFEPMLFPVAMPTPPETFCSETKRVEFLTDVFNPASRAANANASMAGDYLGALNTSAAEQKTTAGILAVHHIIDAYAPKADAAYRFALEVQALRAVIMARKIVPCPETKPMSADATQVERSFGETPSPRAPVGGAEPSRAPISPNDSLKSDPGVGAYRRSTATAPDGQGALHPDALHDQLRQASGIDHARICPMPALPIVVGPNGKVGSGARTREKALNTAVGMLGGLIGGGGGGGGGGANDGPQLVRCSIKDSEMTVFSDPETGVSLSVGARRVGDSVVVFAGVGKSPDSGTFQTAYLQNGEGEQEGPRKVGICELWGEWSLTVSWTRETYVNDQLVSRQEGGWSKSGDFHIPGVLTSEAAPDGLWRRLGFSNASHGARKVALTYGLPSGGDPILVVIHVTRPGQDPVTTTPFSLMMREMPDGRFAFEKAHEDCPPPAPAAVIKTAEAVDQPPARQNPFGPPSPGATVHDDGSWTETAMDGAKTTYRMDGATRVVYPKTAGPPPKPVAPPAPPQGAVANPDGSWTTTASDGTRTTVRPDGGVITEPPRPPAPQTTEAAPPAPPPPPISDDEMFDILQTYIDGHPVEGATSAKRAVGELGGKAEDGQVSYFAHGAEIYRAKFDAQGKLVSAGPTPEARALATMKRFNFAYYSGGHGITAASINHNSDGQDSFGHVSFTDDNQNYRGFMDFDLDGNLVRGIVYKENGDVEARWDGPPDAPKAAAPKLPNLDDLNAQLDQEDGQTKAANLKAWQEEYPPASP